MLRFLIRLTALAVVASLPIPLDAQRPETTERIAKSFKVGPGATLEIQNLSGRVVVTEGGTDTIVIDALKRVRGSLSDPKGELAKAVVEMIERAGRVEVRTTYSARHVRVSVDYTVTAPAGTAVVAKTMSGDVAVTGIKGEVRADTLSGDVRLTGTPAVSLARTMSGDVTVTGVATRGDLRVSSLTGDIVIRSARAGAIEADSTSGSVTLTDIVADRVTAKAFSGDLAFSGSLARAGRYQFQSQSGDIQITLAGGQGFEVDASTFSGSVRVDFPLTLAAGPSPSSQGSRKSVRGVFGDGGAQLTIRAFSGDVTVGKK